VSVKVVLTNCMVELTLPGDLENIDALRVHESQLKMTLSQELTDVVLHLPDRIVTVRRLLLQGIQGTMLPTVGADGVVRWFTEDKKNGNVD